MNVVAVLCTVAKECARPFRALGGGHECGAVIGVIKFGVSVQRGILMGGPQAVAHFMGDHHTAEGGGACDIGLQSARCLQPLGI